jgi:hypothetical protein
MSHHLLLLALVLSFTADAAETSPAIVTGIGQSSATLPRIAGAEAAAAAKAALGGTSPRVVLVFAARKFLVPDLVAGVAESFDKPLIYGCEGYSPITRDGNFASQGHTIANGVAVLALGGSATVTVVSDAVASPGPDKSADKARFTACGKRLAAGLVRDPAATGAVILTFGNQHVGDNQPLVDGLWPALSAPIPLIGVAAGGDTAAEIVRGELVRGVNVALLIQGDFTVGTGLAGGSKEQTPAKAAESVSAARAIAAGRTPALVLLFDCGGRRGTLVANRQIDQEFAAIRTAAGDAPLFGFYGGGEIGMVGGKPSGVGYHVACATLHNR